MSVAQTMLGETVRRQLAESLELLADVMGSHLMGVYLPAARSAARLLVRQIEGLPPETYNPDR